MDETDNPKPTAPEIGSTPSEPAAVVSPTPEPETTPVEEPAVDPVVAPPVVEDNTPPKKEFVPPKPTKKKKHWLLILVILVLIAAAVGAWLMMSKKDTSAPSQTSSSQSQANTVTNTYTPVTVAYAYKDTETNPHTLYWRLANGGDRTAAELKLTAAETINSSDVNGTNVVFESAKAIYVSTDSGKSYKSIVSFGDTGHQIDVKFASDGQSIVYSDLLTSTNKTTVKSLNLSGSSAKTLFTSDLVVDIITYNSQKQEIVYQTATPASDSPRSLPILRDLQTNKITNLLQGLDKTLVSDIAVDINFSKLIYVTSTKNTAAQSDTFTFGAAPYTINSLDLGTNKSTKLTSFGTKDEKNTNGTYKTRTVHVGFLAGTNTPYYTNEGQLYVVKSGSSSLLYEADKPLIYIPFVSADYVIAGSGDQTADYTLNNYNVATKKSVKIFSGDNNTILFGVTTK